MLARNSACPLTAVRRKFKVLGQQHADPLVGGTGAAGRTPKDMSKDRTGHPGDARGDDGRGHRQGRVNNKSHRKETIVSDPI